MERVDLLPLLEGVQEGREGSHVDGPRPEPQEVAEDPVHLHADDARVPCTAR